MRDWRLRQGEIIAIFVFWMAIASFSAVNRLIDPRAAGLRFISPTGPILLGYVESLLWAVLTPGIFFISAWSMRARTNVALRIIVLVLGGLCIAFVANAILDFVRFELFDLPRRRRSMFITPLMSLRPSFFNQFIVYAAVLAGGFAREYSERDRVRQQEAQQLATHAAQLQAQLAGARLEALRMQINPHFLFNTLHAVSALVERDPAGVRRMIARLSELLRYTLDTASTEKVPLEQEIGFVRRYVEIMNVRFQGRLQFAEQIDPAVQAALVPSLILQPLVENALKHGVTRSEGNGRVTLSARRAANRLIVAITDDGPGPGTTGTDSGIGLANTRERLEQMYGSGGAVSLRPAPGGGTVAEVTVPFEVGRE